MTDHPSITTGSTTTVGAINTSRDRPYRSAALYLLLAISSAFFVFTLVRQCQNGFAWDFAINWTAAQGMREGIPIYSHEQLRSLGQSMIGPEMGVMFRDSFTSYIGPPSTALLLLPFTPFAFSQALVLYRIAIVLAFVASILLTGLALPPRSRPLAWLIGALSFLLFNATSVSIGLGQVDAWVMLALSVGILASSRGKWGLAGAGFGLAVLLKVSPILILLYLFLRGRRSILPGAVIATATILGLSALAGKPGDLITR